MLVNCVSRKFAATHRMFSTNVMTCVPGCDELSGPHLPLAHGAICGRNNSRVPQIYLCDFERGFFSMKVSNELTVLGLKYRFASPLRFCCEFIASQQQSVPAPGQPRAGILRGESFLVGNRSLDLLLCRGIRLQ